MDLKPEEFDAPVFNKEQHFGKYMIQPMRIWTENGTDWMQQLVWEIQSIAVPYRDTYKFCRYWGNPKLETKNCGPVDCKCDDCISGRKLVKKGWMPN